MPTTAPASRLVTLRGGVTVPVFALDLLLDLERRGFDLQVDADKVVIYPGSKLTATDRQAIAANRDHLQVLIKYCEAVQ
jgi:hypothetical protein